MMLSPTLRSAPDRYAFNRHIVLIGCRPSIFRTQNAVQVYDALILLRDCRYSQQAYPRRVQPLPRFECKA